MAFNRFFSAFLAQFSSRNMAFGGVFTLALVLSSASFTACKTKEGCAASQKKFINNMDKTTKRGNSNLFSKDMRKRMNKKK